MINTKAIKCYEKGRVLQQKGMLSDAEQAYKKAIKINRNFVEAHNNLGNVLLNQGRLKEASGTYRKALKLLPSHPLLLNNLGNALQMQGKNDEAISWLKKAIDQDPNYAGAHSNLGNALRAQEKFEEAAACYRRSIQIDPGIADRYSNLGAVLVELRELDEAITNIKKAIEIDPGHKLAYYGLGNALFDQNVQFDRNALFDQGELDQAIAAYHKAIEIDPLYRDAYNGLGNALCKQGELDNGIAVYRQAMAIDPGYIQVYHSLARNKKFSEYDDDIRAMESFYATKSISNEKKIGLGFSLGKVFEDIGEYVKAMEFMLQATQLKRASFDYSISEEQDLVHGVKEVFSSEFFSSNKGIGNPDATPIFILGMPRSGTSLVEQILSSHPDVHGAGELNDLMDMTGRIGIPDSSKKFPLNVTDLDSRAFENIGKKYVTSLRKHSENTRFITDKMPHNFLLIGYIKAILPNARIIHLTRDPMDNCLSLFKTFFTKGHHYSYDLTELGEYYNLYLDLMEYWRNTLPESIYDLSYEGLIADQEAQTRQLLDYCDLPWDDACLDFHKTRRVVNTASSAQVRRPMYKDSVKLSKRYGKQLEPLAAALYG
jgi:tetratricopeptide (TPR) repeat protein